VLRILIGHQDTALARYDTGRYDVRTVRYGRDGQTPRTIAEMLEQCPTGWKPDVYYHAGLVHFPVPTDIEDFDGLTATNIQDWHRGGRAVWAGAGFFDLIAAELNAARLLRASGYHNAYFARFWGVDPAIHKTLSGTERDIDVLFIGSLNAVVWEERNRWLDRLARLSERYKVVIAIGHYGEHYTRLTNRAKIVFNRSVNGCANQRAYDAPACGALVFNESENEEVRQAFAEDVHCVYYTSDDFEEKLDYWLDPGNVARRSEIIEAGRQLVLATHTEEAHTNALFALLEEHANAPRYRPNASLPLPERNYRKAVQIFSGSLPASSETALQLLLDVEAELDRASLREARAALQGWMAHYATGDQKVKLFSSAIEWARQAVRAEPRLAIAHMTLAFLLLERAEATQGQHPTGRNDIAEAALALSTAAERCETALAETESEGTADVDGLGYPRWSDLFDGRIERAYLARGVNKAEWGQEVRATIAWRCRSMLSDLSAANAQMEEAVAQAQAAVIDLPHEAEALLRLAQREAMIGHLELSAHHYRAGLALTPFAYTAWPELAAVLVALGRRNEAEIFVQERLQVLQAIPPFAAIRPALLAAIE
jgi:hypothetical protein